MFRSICIISREYPPETGFGGIARMYEMLARALAGEGIAVHVIALDQTGNDRQLLQDGTVVHRLFAPGSEFASGEVMQSLWAAKVAAYYELLDAAVRFDVVLAPEYYAESSQVRPGPHTSLVVRLATCQALIDPPLDARSDPGRYLAAMMEIHGIERADAVLAPTGFIGRHTQRVAKFEFSVIPPIFDASRLVRRAPQRTDRIELLFVGRLEPRKGPELALHALAELLRRGERAHLTYLGRDTDTAPGGGSYRRTVVMPEMKRLGLGYDTVRFVEQRDFDGVQEHLSLATAAIMPSRFENFHTAAVEALAIGVPVFVGDQVGLCEWIPEEDGLVPCSLDDPSRFAATIADRLLDSEWRANAGARGAESVRALFSPEDATPRHIDYFESLPRVPRQRAIPSGPKLGIVMLAYNALGYTKRAVRSVLQHTDKPFRLVVVDNASTDATLEWLRSIDDPRVRIVASDTNLGVSGGRNVGIDALDGDEEYVVFLDNDVEVLAGWPTEFLAALERDPEAGIAGEDGVVVRWTPTGRELVGIAAPGHRCHIAVGFCMFMRRATVRRIGHFDEALGLFWHDDDEYAMRAARIGERIVRVGSGRVIHFEHKSSREVEGIWKSADDDAPAEMSERNQEYLAMKRSRQMIMPNSPFVVLAELDEVLAHPELLTTYAHSFTAADQATLSVYGAVPASDQDVVVERFGEAAASVGFDLDCGPRIALNLLDNPGQDDIAVVGAQAHCVLSTERPGGAFGHLAWYHPAETAALRELAARAWAARPDAPAQGAIGDGAAA